MEPMTKDELTQLGLKVLGANEKIDHKGMLTVECEFDLAQDVDLHGIRFEWKTKRGSLMHIHRFRYDAERKIMVFDVSAPAHDSFKKVYCKGLTPELSIPFFDESAIICNTFVDFCWVLSEGTTARTQMEVSAPFRPESTQGDLTWVLPSKFADDLIEALHVVNSAVIEGFMQNAVLYGPFYTNPS